MKYKGSHENHFTARGYFHLGRAQRPERHLKMPGEFGYPPVLQLGGDLDGGGGVAYV
jgi:hypothetical protein